MVLFENVSMTYPGGELRAIDNMSFAIEDGEFVLGGVFFENPFWSLFGRYIMIKLFYVTYHNLT